jgi:AcrR family transcriptional regulator
MHGRSEMNTPGTQGKVGRPREDHRREVRARLSAAARELFARHGFDAVSLRQVADRSGVTPAMVHYYFGDKRGLWLAVLEDYLEEALGRMLAARGEIEGPDGLETYLAQHARLLGDQPWVAPLLFREVILGGGPSVDFVERFPARLRDLLRGAVARAKERGEIDPSLDTDMLVLSLLAGAIFPFLVRPMVERLFDLPVDADFTARWADHTASLFRRGARP